MTETKLSLALEQVLNKSAFENMTATTYYKSIELCGKHPRKIFIDISRCNNHYITLEVFDTFYARTLLAKRVGFKDVKDLVQKLNTTIKREIKEVL
jgi:hypothetical protein